MRHLVIAALLAPTLALAQGTYVNNISGTITTGGSAQTISPFNPSRRGCSVQNVSSGDLWISDIGTAAASQPSIKIAAGAQYQCASPGGLATNGALSLFGATTGQAFAGREW